MSPRKKAFIVFDIILTLIILAYGIWYMQLRTMIANMSKPQPLPTVSSTLAKTSTWQNQLTAVGTFTAIKGADLRPEATGLIREIHFESGQMVKQGDLLFTLNDSIEQADRLQNAATLRLAKLDFERKSKLVQIKVLEQVRLDEAKAALAEAKGRLDRSDALIAQKHIRAPFAGRAGIRQVSIGDYVSPQSVLVSIQMIDPIHFDFTLPEQHINKLKVGQEVTASVDGQKELFKGKLTAINSNVDTDSHTIRVQSQFANVDHALTPGVFGNLTIDLGTSETVIALPQTALTYSLFGDSVFLVKKEMKDGKQQLIVHRQGVKTGERRGADVIILSGVAINDQVVISGQNKIEDKAAIAINNNS